MKSAQFTLLIAVAVLAICSQPIVRAAIDSPVPQLLVPDEKKAEEMRPLRMSGLEIDVEVIGRRATTTLTMTFRNELDRVLEGELVFPLRDGEAVSRFAMSLGDITKMREGAVIEKNRGRQIFESTVRKQIDPGLLEMTKGNHFRSRVYPIPAKGEKRIIVGFEGSLREVGGVLSYELPLVFKQKIDRFKAQARVVALGGEKPSFAGLLEDKVHTVAERLHHTGVEHTDFKPDKPLRISIPNPGDRGVQVLTFSEPKRNKPQTFFHVTVPVKHVARAGSKPATVCLLWDASGSSALAEREVALKALEAYFKTLGDAVVSVVAFRDRPEPARDFDLADKALGGVIEHLRAIPADGGTRFGGLDLKKYDADSFVLVSDGLATFGKDEIALGSKPVIVLNASKSADHGYLRSVARGSGGQYINLDTTTAEAAAALMVGERFTFLGFEGGADSVEEVYPATGAPAAGGSFEFAGILNGKRAELTLKFGFGDEVTLRQKVVVESGAPGQSQRARRLWAQAKIDELGLRFENNRDEIVAVAKKHAIVTRATSLIVLDSLDDYVTHRVIPPKEMEKEYFERIEASELAEEKPLREHLEQVVEKFAEMKKWYQHEFPGLEVAVAKAARFELDRAEAMLKRTGGLRLLKRQKLTKEALEPARRFLVEATALNKVGNELQKGDEAGRAEWEKWASELAKSIAAHAAGLDQAYPEFSREAVADGGGAHPFGGEGLADNAPARRENAADPFSAPAESNAPTDAPRPRRARRDDAFPVTPATPAADGDFDPPEIPQTLGEGFGYGFGGQAGGKAGESTPAAGASAISLKKWDPKAPYLKALKSAKGDDIYRVYLNFRRDHLDSSAFFLDVADFFIERGRRDLALRVLSNVAEMDLENAPLLRILGHRLLQLDEEELAVAVFEEVLEIRGEEPQSYRDLALAKQAAGDKKRAAELLWEIVKRPWDGRFSDIELVALGELNALLASGDKDLIPAGMDERLRSEMPVDLRVVLTWDADNTDIDLWVVDPTGEVCNYNHNRTLTGGRMSSDFTAGYGPEEFLIKRALPGKYTVKAHFYGNRQQTLAGATTIQAKITTGFGLSSEKTEAVTLRLKDEKEFIEIGAVEIGN